MAANTIQALELDPKKSLFGANNILYQTEFLQKVINELEENPASVLADLNEYREACKEPKVFFFLKKNLILVVNSVFT